MSIKQLIHLMTCLSTTTYAAITDGGCTEEAYTCPGGENRAKGKDCLFLFACPLVLVGESCDEGRFVSDSNPCAQGRGCNADDETAVCECVLGVVIELTTLPPVRREKKICQLAEKQPLSDDSSNLLDFNVYLMVFTGVLAIF